MKAQWQALLARYWSVRSVNERRAILAAATILLPILFYLLLWRPAHQEVEKLQRSLPTLRAQAARLQEQAREAESLRHRPQPATLDVGNMQAAIEESAQRHLLRDSINTLSMQDDHTVRVTLDSVSFALWIKWLHELQREQHIRAESVSISALPQAGRVAISAMLTTGAAP
jgi:general secretion pathway protein M